MKQFLDRCILPILFLLIIGRGAAAESIFIEAETFTSPSNGWRVAKNSQTRSASRIETLHGAHGDTDAVASKQLSISKPGQYRIWVRHLYHQRWRGAFQVAVAQKGKQLASKHFDTQPVAETKDWSYTWDYFDAELPAGKLQLKLSKFNQKNCPSYVRHIDCFLLTTDLKKEPNHIAYGPQTYLRVTLGDIYDQPVYIHVFVDHYRSPWYQHFHLSKAGAHPGLRPEKKRGLPCRQRANWLVQYHPDALSG